MLRALIITLMAASLAACGTLATKAVQIGTPAKLLELCQYPLPPDEQEYLSANNDGKEKLWKKAFDNGLLLVSQCNVNIKEARHLNSEE